MADRAAETGADLPGRGEPEQLQRRRTLRAIPTAAAGAATAASASPLLFSPPLVVPPLPPCSLSLRVWRRHAEAVSRPRESTTERKDSLSSRRGSHRHRSTCRIGFALTRPAPPAGPRLVAVARRRALDKANAIMTHACADSHWLSPAPRANTQSSAIEKGEPQDGENTTRMNRAARPRSI